MFRLRCSRGCAALAVASTLALVLSAVDRARADAPALVPIQGFLTASDGTPIDGDRSLAFRVYDAASGGGLLYQETRTVGVVAGDFVVYLGEVTPLPLSLFRDEEDLWLEVVIDGTDVVAPRTRLATGPYAGLAQYCEGANTLDGNDASDFALAAHDHSFASLTSIPAGLSDGDDDTLGELSCGADQIAKRIGGAWACADDEDTDTDTLGDLGCTSGQLVRATAGGYGCVTPAPVATSGSYADLTGVPSGLLSGSGAANYLPRYTGATTLAPSTVYQNGSNNVGVGTIGPNVRLDVNGEVAWGTSATRPNRLGSAEGGSIELGDSSVGGSRPFIDFHFGNAMSEDYNVRVSNEADGELRVRADVFRMEAASGAANVSMGHVSNAITVGASSATISGGGASGAANDNRVTDSGGTVSGGAGNRAGDAAGGADDATYATVGGGYRNAANGFEATVGGGTLNTALGLRATVAGGYGNAADDQSFVGGGSGNTLAAGGHTVIGGGSSNTGNDAWVSVIAGGGGNDVSEFYYSVIGGGAGNDANAAYYSVVGGGSANTIDSAGTTTSYSVIGGGSNNSITGGVGNTVIGGGNGNSVLNDTYSAVIAGGNENTVVNFYGTVSGGSNNIVSGDYATIPGGGENSAPGNYSFAAGRRAKANSRGCFAWGDDTPADVNCNADNAWVARASGGVTFYSNAGMTAGVTLAAGGGAWASVSDRALKRDVEPVNVQRVLEAVERMPIGTWRYTTEVSGARHMGPMAQDFRAAFGLGDDDKRITTVDADGVALAALQGLGARTREQQREVAALKREHSALRADVQALRAQNAELLARLERLEARGDGGGSGSPGYSWLGWASSLLAGFALVLGYRQKERA